MNNPLISIIIPAYNSSRTLEACLRSIKEQTYSPIELIVVDNHSTDGTAGIAKKYTEKVFIKGPERSTQRNFGVSQSLGEYVAIIDSDMKLSKDVIQQCVNIVLAGPEISGVTIPEESFGVGFWAKCKQLERSFYVGLEWMEAARFFPKQIFLKAGGYNEDLISGEDWDLSQKAAKEGSMGRISAFIYHNEGHATLFGFMKKKFYYAQKISKYISTGHPNLAKQTNIFQRYLVFLRQPLRLIKNPVLASGMLFMKTCEFASVGLGLIMSKINR
jgi:glycosyltransferase involved in cell wall biosynthesis